MSDASGASYPGRMRPLLPIPCLCALLAAQETPPPKPAAPSEKAPPMSWTGALDEKAFAALHDHTDAKAPKPTGEAIRVGDAEHYLSLPKDGKAPLPAVLLIHEWYGLNDHIRHWADRLAADGYATLAVDLYGGKVATKREEASALMQAVDKDEALATLKAAFDFLGTEPRIRSTRRASLGWCFGGGWSLQLAIAEPRLDACVIYYGRLVDDVETLRAIKAPVLGVFGTRDRGIPMDSVKAFEAAMQRAERPCRVLAYDAEHAFANPSGARYDRENAAKAWTEVRAFLRERLVGAVAAAPAAGAKGTGHGR
jgi:carboxymethylenebutenolidase